MEPVLLVTQGEIQFAFKLFLSEDALSSLHELSLTSTPHLQERTLELRRFNDARTNGLALFTIRETEPLQICDPWAALPPVNDTPPPSAPVINPMVKFEDFDLVGGFQEFIPLHADPPEFAPQGPPISHALQVDAAPALPCDWLVDLEQLVRPLVDNELLHSASTELDVDSGLLLSILDKPGLQSAPGTPKMSQEFLTTKPSVEDTRREKSEDVLVETPLVTAKSQDLTAVGKTYILLLHTDHDDVCPCPDCMLLKPPLNFLLMQTISPRSVVIVFILKAGKLTNIAVAPPLFFLSSVKKVASRTRPYGQLTRIAQIMLNTLRGSSQDLLWLQAEAATIRVIPVVERERVTRLLQALVPFVAEADIATPGTSFDVSFADTILQNALSDLPRVYEKRRRLLGSLKTMWFEGVSYDSHIVSALLRPARTMADPLLLAECLPLLTEDIPEAYLAYSLFLLTAEEVLVAVFACDVQRSPSVESWLWRALFYIHVGLDFFFGCEFSFGLLEDLTLDVSETGAALIRCLTFTLVGLARVCCLTRRESPCLPLWLLATGMRGVTWLERRRLTDSIKETGAVPLPSWLDIPPLRIQLEYCSYLLRVAENSEATIVDLAKLEADAHRDILPPLTPPAGLVTFVSRWETVGRFLDPQAAVVAPLLSATGSLVPHCLTVGLQRILDSLGKLPEGPEMLSALCITRGYYVSFTDHMASVGRFTKALAYCQQAVRLFQTYNARRYQHEMHMRRVGLFLRTKPDQLLTRAVDLPVAPAADAHKWLSLWDAAITCEPAEFNQSDRFMICMLGLGIVAGQMANCLPQAETTVQTMLLRVMEEVHVTLGGSKPTPDMGKWIDFEDDRLLPAAHDILKTAKNYLTETDGPLAAIRTVVDLTSASLYIRQFTRRRITPKHRRNTLSWLAVKFSKSLPSPESVVAAEKFIHNVEAVYSIARELEEMSHRQRNRL
ncbi:MAG: hypothetical protein KVP17_000505 [Porospora cf. gigantea B]|uniref:uncharacterized protein n=1 Tax=Porospora cf. gigantea B TaxID=2853592 RepID=UPI003571967C|nr:MAG: hypothetical protein KVP17_000505 [Porospora cf. gigantea B]